MDIGKNIRNLRDKNNITQEKLAEYLNISPQAVSKWENGTALPDITLVPVIAAFFEVSTDALFGIDMIAVSEKEKEYNKKYGELCAAGDTKGRCKLMREALSEFPRNYGFMNNLARTLFHIRNDESFPKEVISLCERIIRDCRDNATVSSAINTLARTYALTGDSEKAQKYANMLPPMKYSRERALEWALEGEERNERLQTDTLQYLLLMTEKMGGRLGWEAGPFRSYENEPPSSEQRITICQTMIDMLKVIFPDENYLLLNGRIAEAYRRMALEYARMRDRDKTMETLLLCEKYGDKFDEDAVKNSKYTSIFLTVCILTAVSLCVTAIKARMRER